MDTFLVYIQSSFVQDETTAVVLKVLGNVVQGSEAEYADDGMTQRVTARAADSSLKIRQNRRTMRG